MEDDIRDIQDLMLELVDDHAVITDVEVTWSVTEWNGYSEDKAATALDGLLTSRRLSRDLDGVLERPAA